MTRIPDADSIPVELRRLDQWVAWRTETRNGSATKPPYSPITGTRGAVDNPTTWASFEVAVDYARKTDADGIGFVFSASDPYLGVDLDHCRNLTTGEVEEWAARIIERLGSYCEVSPSGTGVHIIVRAKLPDGSRHRVKLGTGSIEIYDQGRFFTITGIRLPE